MAGFDGKIEGERIPERARPEMICSPESEEIYNGLFKDDYEGGKIEKPDMPPMVFDAREVMDGLFADDFEEAEDSGGDGQEQDGDDGQEGEKGSEELSDVGAELEYDEDGTRELTDDEKQKLKDTLGWPEKKINENCRIDKDGVIHYKTDCQDKEGTTSDCGVPYERKTIVYKGIKIEGVFPVFDSVFDTELDESDYQSSSAGQFKKCNNKLKEAIEKDPELRAQFTDEQLEDIKNGRTPRGYTWHHAEDPGKMQLVKTEDHDRRIGGAAHTGGNSIWGNKSMDKSDENPDGNAQKGETF